MAAGRDPCWRTGGGAARASFLRGPEPGAARPSLLARERSWRPPRCWSLRGASPRRSPVPEPLVSLEAPRVCAHRGLELRPHALPPARRPASLAQLCRPRVCRPLLLGPSCCPTEASAPRRLWRCSSSSRGACVHCHHRTVLDSWGFSP